jgi:hypothetical protein
MTVNVAAGVMFVPGTEGAQQALYTCVAPSVTNLGLTAAHASLPRIDIVVATVRDSAYSGANNDWLLQIIAGTAAGSPTAPAAPANSLVLAQIAVAATTTTITNANITDVRQYSPFGIIPCRNTTDYPNPALEGMVVYNMADDNLASYNGTTWTSAKGTGFLQRVIFTASGTFTKATYPGLKKVRVCVQGAGGGGGGCQTASATQVSAAGGGQGGGYAESWLDASSLAASVTVTVGAVGTGGAINTVGTAGGQSSFGATVVAGGGAGGGAGGASNTAFALAGGNGAQTLTGDVVAKGSAGGWGVRLGGAGSSGGAVNPVAGQRMAGNGGGAYLGGGGHGGANTAGENGGSYGGGGGGASTDPSGAGRVGGDGAIGIVYVDLYV